MSTPHQRSSASSPSAKRNGGLCITPRNGALGVNMKIIWLMPTLGAYRLLARCNT
jgi:hypothetical protein